MRGDAAPGISYDPNSDVHSFNLDAPLDMGGDGAEAQQGSFGVPFESDGLTYTVSDKYEIKDTESLFGTVLDSFASTDEYGQTILVPVTVENKAEAPVESIGWIDLGVTGPSDDDDAGDLLLFSQQLGKRVDPGKRADFYIPLRYVGDGDYSIEFEPANTALTLHVEK